MSNTTRFLTVRQWTEQHPWPPLGGLRHLIYNAKHNGLDAVVRRVGRRVLIDEAAFLIWVDGHVVSTPSRPRPCSPSARNA